MFHRVGKTPIGATTMPRFEVLAGTLVVGHSELELGDPPMGVAAGKFVPTTGYATIQGLVVAAREGSQADLGLAVRLIGAEPIPAQGGVLILDYSAELGDDGIQIEVLGIPHPLYEKLFPQEGGRTERSSL